jgi:L-threonylcarbamoyladenylate synthase
MSRVITIDYPEALTMAVEVLQSGGLVVLPTDTVYGVGCLLKAPAIDRVFAAKRRTPEKAIPVLLASIDDARQVVDDFPERARRLAEAFWPGPLTLVLPKRADLPENLTTLTTVGVRVPDHAATRAIIAAAGGVLAVTSANRSDQPPACTIQSAIRYLSDAVMLYLDDGTCVGGVPSTVVAFEDGEPVIVRQGPITEEDVCAALA